MSLRDLLSLRPEFLDSFRQIDRVPQGDGSHHQVEAAGTVALILEGAVSDFT